MLHLSSHPELEQRLGLYRIFLKLYEYHPGLLETILGLEASGSGLKHQLRCPYVQVVTQDKTAYLITNLGQEGSRSIVQPENIWVIGRDHQAAIVVSDPCLSRYHAAIQWLDGVAYLIDLASTNGSFIDGKPVRQATPLKDGDQIQMGSLSFTFFKPHSIGQAQSLSPKVMQMIDTSHTNQPCNSGQSTPVAETITVERRKSRSLNDESLEETVGFVKPASAQAHTLDSQLEEKIPDSLQEYILDRFLKRQHLRRPFQD